MVKAALRDIIRTRRSRALWGNRMGKMIIREIQAKSILSVSKVYNYVVNPYTGCQHACSYCYARFMKRFTRHNEPWANLST